MPQLLHFSHHCPSQNSNHLCFDYYNNPSPYFQLWIFSSNPATSPTVWQVAEKQNEQEMLPPTSHERLIHHWDAVGLHGDLGTCARWQWTHTEPGQYESSQGSSNGSRVNGSWSRSLKAKAAAEMGRWEIALDMGTDMKCKSQAGNSTT